MSILLFQFLLQFSQAPKARSPCLNKIKDFTLVPHKVTSLSITIFRIFVFFCCARNTVHGPLQVPLDRYLEKLRDKMSKVSIEMPIQYTNSQTPLVCT